MQDHMILPRMPPILPKYYYKEVLCKSYAVSSIN